MILTALYIGFLIAVGVFSFRLTLGILEWLLAIVNLVCESIYRALFQAMRWARFSKEIILARYQRYIQNRWFSQRLPMLRRQTRQGSDAALVERLMHITRRDESIGGSRGTEPYRSFPVKYKSFPVKWRELIQSLFKGGKE